MEIKEMEASLDAFFENDNVQVLFLKGPWGGGKSYFVRDYLSKNKPSTPLYQFFVSLFGVENLREVREAINASIKILPPPDNEKGRWSAKGLSWINKGTKLIKEAPDISGIPVSKLAGIGSSLFWFMVRQQKSVIVFDDLERADLKPHKILGLASSLAENTKTKIIVIFNEQKFSEDDIKKLNEYREKVVDIELLFKPPIDNVVDSYLNEKAIRQQVTLLFRSLDSCNIRIIKKINVHLEQFKKLVGKSGIELSTEECLRVAKIVCINYLSKKHITHQMVDSGFFGLYLRKDKTEEGEQLDDLVKKINMFPAYPLDGLALELIQNGYCSTDSKSAYIDKYKDNVARDKYNVASSKAYAKYGDNFLSKPSEVFADMEDFLNEYSSQIENKMFVMHLNFLKSIGYVKSLEPWKEAHLTLIKSLSTVNEQLEAANLLLPSEVAEKYISNLKIANASTVIPLNLINKLVKSGTWDEGDWIALDALSEDGVYDWLTTETDTKLIDSLREFKKYGTTNSQAATSFSRKLDGAIKRIGQRSKLDETRVKNLFTIS